MRFDFFSIPAVKFGARAMAHGCQLALYFTVLLGLASAEELRRLEPSVPPPTVAEALLSLWLAGDALDLAQQLRNLSTALLPAESTNTAKVHLFVTCTVAAALGLRAVSLVGVAPYALAHSAYVSYQLILSLMSVPVCVRTLDFYWTSRVGTLVIVMKVLVSDLIQFLLVFCAFLLGFCLAFTGLYREEGATDSDGAALAPHAPPHPSPNGTARLLGARANPLVSAPTELARVAWYVPTAPTMSPLWAVFGEFELETIDGLTFGAPLLWTCILLLNVVLVNLLVAMFTDTYSRIKSNSELESTYRRCVNVYWFRRGIGALPPPLNLWPLLAFLPRLAVSTLSALSAHLARIVGWTSAAAAAPAPGSTGRGERHFLPPADASWRAKRPVADLLSPARRKSLSRDDMLLKTPLSRQNSGVSWALSNSLRSYVQYYVRERRLRLSRSNAPAQMPAWLHASHSTVRQQLIEERALVVELKAMVERQADALRDAQQRAQQDMLGVGERLGRIEGALGCVSASATEVELVGAGLGTGNDAPPSRLDAHTDGCGS